MDESIWIISIKIALLHANKLDNSSQKPPIHNISSIGTTYKYLLKTGAMASRVWKRGCCHTPIVMFEPGQEVGSAGKKKAEFCLSRNFPGYNLAGRLSPLLFFFLGFGGMLLGVVGCLLGSCWIWSGLAGGQPICGIIFRVWWDFVRVLWDFVRVVWDVLRVAFCFL